MRNNHITLLFRLLDRILVSGPLRKTSVEVLLGISLQRFDGNRFYDFYQGGRTEARGVIIQRVELRLRKGAPGVGLLLLNVEESPCVTPADIESQYTDMSIDTPRGDSPNELVYYTAHLPSARLSFGFAQSDPSCLVRLVIDATEVPDAER